MSVVFRPLGFCDQLTGVRFLGQRICSLIFSEKLSGNVQNHPNLVE